ncbi:MAG: GlcG/HbpS family heme-binding protein [Gemmatimonadales bacterium]
MQAPDYGPPIPLAAAKRVAEAAEAEALKIPSAVVIAVVDSTGHLVVLHRMDQALYGGVAIAQAKAQTAVDFKRPTKVFEEAVAGGGGGLRFLAAGLCPLEGGIPLLENGMIIGAIGVAGGAAGQDVQAAAAGARVING